PQHLRIDCAVVVTQLAFRLRCAEVNAASKLVGKFVDEVDECRKSLPLDCLRRRLVGIGATGGIGEQSAKVGISLLGLVQDQVPVPQWKIHPPAEGPSWKTARQRSLWVVWRGKHLHGLRHRRATSSTGAGSSGRRSGLPVRPWWPATGARSG